MIVLDAFSGDAIPAHLLTDESFDLYEEHLRKDASGKPDGVIVCHISNRYIDLEPVVAALAKKYGYQTLNVHKDEEGGFSDTGSDWVLVSKNEEFLNNPDRRMPRATRCRLTRKCSGPISSRPCTRFLKGEW